LVSKKYWKKPIVEFIDLLNQVEEKKYIEVLGVTFQVLPGVFSPVYSSDTAWFAQKIVPLALGKSFLEIGSGSGVIACLAAINGATNVTATDINPKSIDNIRLNAKLHSLDISINEGSVFDPIPKDKLFDIVFWNHPFYYADRESTEKSMIESSVYDTEYQSLKKFFGDGRKHLTSSGQLLLGTSNVGRINLIKKMAVDEGFTSVLLEKVDVPIYKGKKVKMDLRIYSFKIS